MTKEVATLERNDKLSIANNVMQLGRIRHLVVLDSRRHRVGELERFAHRGPPNDQSC